MRSSGPWSFPSVTLAPLLGGFLPRPLLPAVLGILALALAFIRVRVKLGSHLEMYQLQERRRCIDKRAFIRFAIMILYRRMPL